MLKTKVAVIGASTDPSRYSFLCIKRLVERGFQVEAIGKSNGSVKGIQIQNGKPHLNNIHTVTIYISPENQKDMQEYILSLNPKRIIFNPGSENTSFAKTAINNKIEVTEKCTLVMLSIGNF